MAERRSLGAALIELSPEKRAFIQTGQVQKDEAAKERVAPPAKPVMDESSLERDEEPAANTPQPVRRRSRGRRSSRTDASVRESFDAFPGLASPWVSVTTRVRPETAVALKRASLEQRLKGREPSMLQEIADEAIQRWLQDNGYLE